MSSSSPTEIPLAELSISQLNTLSQQIDQEIEFLQASLSQLKSVQQKFVESLESVTKVTEQNEGADVLVPLSSSMYVTGKVADVQHVLIDIGTGYFAEMTLPQAKSHFQRKVDYVTKQMELVQPKLQEKAQIKQAIMEILQMKVQSQISAQQMAAPAKS